MCIQGGKRSLVYDYAFRKGKKIYASREEDWAEGSNPRVYEVLWVKRTVSIKRTVCQKVLISLLNVLYDPKIETIIS